MSTKYITLAERNYKKLLKVIPCLTDINTYSLDSYGKSQSSGFMDFNLDFINITDSYIDIAISHYFRQNADSIPDPDMIVRVYIDLELVFPLTYQDQFGYNVKLLLVDHKDQRDGIFIVSKKLYAGLVTFYGGLKKGGDQFKHKNKSFSVTFYGIFYILYSRFTLVLH